MSREPREQAEDDVTITLDGEELTGLAGQSIAAVVLASGRVSWRRTSAGDRPRGVFCGIGICFDCLAVVNGLGDVRTCQRRAADGDVVETQHHPLSSGSEIGDV
jgi:predicted molibdopterin-dependent oxidoreductase YjgC